MNLNQLTQQEISLLTPEGELLPRVTEQTAPFWCMMAEQTGAQETRNSVQARYEVAVYLMENCPDLWPEDVERYLTMAADSDLGHAGACMALAKWLMARDPRWRIKRDGEYSQVVRRLEDALSAGEEEAAWLLGECYARGWGTERDYEQAQECFARWARSNGGEAMLQLAIYYRTGAYGFRSVEKSHVWLARAQAAGIADARERLNEAPKKGDA